MSLASSRSSRPALISQLHVFRPILSPYLYRRELYRYRRRAVPAHPRRDGMQLGHAGRVSRDAYLRISS